MLFTRVVTRVNVYLFSTPLSPPTQTLQIFAIYYSFCSASHKEGDLEACSHQQIENNANIQTTCLSRSALADHVIKSRQETDLSSEMQSLSMEDRLKEVRAEVWEMQMEQEELASLEDQREPVKLREDQQPSGMH